jgi:festuclavine dehydrogenase
MTILLTGGTGKTSTCLASLLQAAGIPYILASRNPAPSATNAVNFDWFDATTFNNPFSVDRQEKVTAAYLIQPQNQNPSQSMIDFVDVAVENGVKRFVVLTGSGDEMGSPYHAGGVWKYLDDKKLEYCVLRATWFMGMSSFLSTLSSRVLPTLITMCSLQ